MASDNRGYDAGRGRRRHRRVSCVDTLGLLLVVIVTAANVQTGTAANARWTGSIRMPSVALVWADSGYAGRLVAWAQQALRVALEIVRKKPGQRTFEVLPPWGGRPSLRSPAAAAQPDYERSVAHSEVAMVLGHDQAHDQTARTTPGRQPWQRK